VKSAATHNIGSVVTLRHLETRLRPRGRHYHFLNQPRHRGARACGWLREGNRHTVDVSFSRRAGADQKSSAAPGFGLVVALISSMIIKQGQSRGRQRGWNTLASATASR